MNTYQELVYEIATIRGNIARTQNMMANCTFEEAEEISPVLVQLNSELDAAIDYLYTNYPDGDPDAGPCPVNDMGCCQGWCAPEYDDTYSPCDDCDCAEDGRDFCEFGDSAHNGLNLTIAISEDLDQSYQLDVLLNELQVFGSQIEYLQDQNDDLECQLAEAELAIDYWVGEASEKEEAKNDYDNLLSIFKALQIDYSNLEKTLFSERASFDKANDLLHDDIIDLQMKLRATEKRLYDTSERAADYWKRLKSTEAES